jgi:dTDP-4-amino-4,6-dideoxygalactose transaminase
LQSRLAQNGIETKIHYQDALYDLEVGFHYVDHVEDRFTETASFTRECLSLPIYPELSDCEVETIVDCIKHYIDS